MFSKGADGVLLREIETGIERRPADASGLVLDSGTPASVGSSPLGGYWLVVDDYGAPSSPIASSGWFVGENDPVSGGVGAVYGSTDLLEWTYRGPLTRAASPDARAGYGVTGTESLLLAGQAGIGITTKGWVNGYPLRPIFTRSGGPPSLAFGRAASPEPTCAKLILGDFRVINPSQYSGDTLQVQLGMTYLNALGKVVVSVPAPEWDAPIRASEPVPEPRCWVLEIVTSPGEKLRFEVDYSDGTASFDVPVADRPFSPVTLFLDGEAKFTVDALIHVGPFGAAQDPSCLHVSL